MQAQFHEMYALQNRLNINTNGNEWATTGVTLQGRQINWLRCIYMEAAEAIDSLNWKHWKDINKADDIENIKIELVDIWHFVMSEHIVLKGLEQAVHDGFLAYNEVINADAKLYEALDLIDFLEEIIAQAATDEFPLHAFFKAVRALPEFDMHDVYKLYIGKNCLNQFRQDHGYKEGTYQKIWNGKEDNVTMQGILDATPEISYEHLYLKLEEAYGQI